jgi:uncharacterized cupin superfamily protein
MANTPHKINVNELKLMPFGKGDKFAAGVGRIGELLGMSKGGCSLVELDPGKCAWPYHLHFAQEELFIILQGEGTLRYDDAMHPLRTGDIVFAPTGQGTAHQIINTSAEKLRYLALSSASDTEVCFYPDSGKYGAYSKNPNKGGIRFIARESSSTDYWEGEA